MPMLECKIVMTIDGLGEPDDSASQPAHSIQAEFLASLGLSVDNDQAVIELASKIALTKPRMCDLELECADRGHEALIHLHRAVRLLLQSRILSLSTGSFSPLATLSVLSDHCRTQLPMIDRSQQYRLSRFVFIGNECGGNLFAESALGATRITLLRPEALAVIQKLARGCSVDDLGTEESNSDDYIALVQMFLFSDFIVPCTDQGERAEDKNRTLVQWEFHDLLMHSRSRLGRAGSQIGGSYRFRNMIEPQPAVKRPPPCLRYIPLKQLSLESLLPSDEPFSAVLERRRSIRVQQLPALSTDKIGEFLFRVARVRSLYNTPAGEFTNRPYASGGASYELELYLTVNSSVDLERGFYYYNPTDHSLLMLRRPTLDMEMLLEEAWLASAQTCRPQLLLTLAARFQRVSWKYQGMAYATILKNVGALYSTMYLVATAMDLAPCALGLGNPDRFCKVAGTDYLSESSVGEFMLGSS